MRNWTEDQDSTNPSRVIHLGKSNRTPLSAIPLDNALPSHPSTIKSTQSSPSNIPQHCPTPTPTMVSPAQQILLPTIL